MALTDHDTLDGLAEAFVAGAGAGVRVVGGCEFSVAASWGELHVLGYFLEAGQPALERFLERCRADRERRGLEMVERLQRLGLEVQSDELIHEAGGGAIGRPHLARLLARRGLVSTIQDAFDRYLGRGRPAYVEKRLPGFREVADLVHASGGVVAAAHLRERGTRGVVAALAAEGLDAVETRHPRHSAEHRARLTDLALELALARTGGSDWHGDEGIADSGGRLGGQQVPEDWLADLEAKRRTPTPAPHLVD
jgi:predicted metal-dependent phosphoesterase TrpH